MKKVLCILSNMNKGGAETFLMKIFRSLDKTKYSMDFCVTVNSKCDYEDEIIRLNGHIYRITPKTVNTMRFKKELSELIKSNNYSSVLRITSNGMGFLDLKIAKKNGVRKTIARSSNSSDGGSLKMRAANLVGRILWKRYIDEYVAPSDLAAIYTFGLKDYQKGKVHLLNNGLDFNYYKFSESDRLRIRNEYNIHHDTVLIGHIGRFMEQKNHMFLVDIFAEYVKLNPNSKLFLVGEGELKYEIQRRIEELNLEDFVHLLGVRSDIPAILSAIDVFVFPSLYEGMPNTVIEAEAVGVPCIISNTITKNVLLNDNIYFMDIKEKAKVWADKITLINKDKQIPSQSFVNQYDITNVVHNFCQIVFE